jgi:hypothetical protein
VTKAVKKSTVETQRPCFFFSSLLNLTKLGLLGLGSGFAESPNPDRLLLQRVAALPPGFKSPQQRAHAGYSLAFEQERHTGARGFAGSTTVEHDVAVAGNFQVTLLDFLGVHVYGSGYLGVVSLELNGMA